MPKWIGRSFLKLVSLLKTQSFALWYPQHLIKEICRGTFGVGSCGFIHGPDGVGALNAIDVHLYANHLGKLLVWPFKSDLWKMASGFPPLKGRKRNCIFVPRRLPLLSVTMSSHCLWKYLAYPERIRTYGRSLQMSGSDRMMGDSANGGHLTPQYRAILLLRKFLNLKTNQATF